MVSYQKQIQTEVIRYQIMSHCYCWMSCLIVLLCNITLMNCCASMYFPSLSMYSWSDCMYQCFVLFFGQLKKCSLFVTFSLSWSSDQATICLAWLFDGSAYSFQLLVTRRSGIANAADVCNYFFFCSGNLAFYKHFGESVGEHLVFASYVLHHQIIPHQRHQKSLTLGGCSIYGEWGELEAWDLYIAWGAVGPQDIYKTRCKPKPSLITFFGLGMFLLMSVRMSNRLQVWDLFHVAALSPYLDASRYTGKVVQILCYPGCNHFSTTKITMYSQFI